MCISVRNRERGRRKEESTHLWALCPLRYDTSTLLRAELGLLQQSAVPQAPFTPSFCLPPAFFFVLFLLGLDTVEMELNYLTENTALCPDFLSFTHTHAHTHLMLIHPVWEVLGESVFQEPVRRKEVWMRGKIRGPQGLVWPCTLSINCCLPMPRSALMRVCLDPCTKCHHPHTHTWNTARTYIPEQHYYI